MQPEVMVMRLRDKIRSMAVISLIAEQEGLTTDDVRREMQLVLNEAWASADPAAQQRQKELFPDGKPSLERFILVLAGVLAPKN